MRFHLLLISTLLFGVAQARTQTVKAAGAQHVFDVSQSEAANAISNAFASYKGMALFSAETEGFIPGWHKTNGWILFPLNGPMAVARWKNTDTMVPYIGTFHIAIQSLASNRTAVSVRTIDARVIHGKEIGVHGGWANHEVDVPPVLSEETNVLMAVSNALVAGKRGGAASPTKGNATGRTQQQPAVPGSEQEAFDAAVKAAAAARDKAGGTNQH
jgi:hypothetical protein